jgi:hypothetical protein
MLLSESARVRGFRLEGYGVFFDVEVPDLEGTLPWSFRTLDQNGLDMVTAWNAIRSHLESDAAKDVRLQQALKRLELQVAPLAASMSATSPSTEAGTIAASTPARPTPSVKPVEPADPSLQLSGALHVSAASSGADQFVQPEGAVLENPEEAYREAVKEALMDAMIEHSRGLNVGATEWLTVAARRNDSGARITPTSTESRTVVIRVRGADLSAFLGGQIGREEARARMDVRVF